MEIWLQSEMLEILKLVKLTPVTPRKVFLGPGKKLFSNISFSFCQTYTIIYTIRTAHQSVVYAEMPKSVSFIFETHKTPHETANAIRECFSAHRDGKAQLYYTTHCMQ